MNSLDFPDDGAANLSQTIGQTTSPFRNKNIVICCDGTSNDVASDSTNVLRLFRSLERSERQIAFYDSGVGTLADPTKITRVGKYCSRMLDQGIGHGVRENVCTAYRFLARPTIRVTGFFCLVSAEERIPSAHWRERFISSDWSGQNSNILTDWHGPSMRMTMTVWPTSDSVMEIVSKARSRSMRRLESRSLGPGTRSVRLDRPGLPGRYRILQTIRP